MTKEKCNRFRILVGTIGLSAILIGVGLCYSLKGDGSTNKTQRGTGLSIGSRAPDFALNDPQGKTNRLSDYKGKVVLIDFWATWCAPCQKELPLIQRIYDRYKDEGLVVLTISVDRQQSIVSSYMWENGYTFPVLLADSEVQLAYKVRGIPALFLLDRKGSVRFYQRGFKPRLEEKISGTISKLL